MKSWVKAQYTHWMNAERPGWCGELQDAKPPYVGPLTHLAPSMAAEATPPEPAGSGLSCLRPWRSLNICTLPFYPVYVFLSQSWTDTKFLKSHMNHISNTVYYIKLRNSVPCLVCLDCNIKSIISIFLSLATIPLEVLQVQGHLIKIKFYRENAF